jgi:membrane-associated phospholipid phosphatase
MANKHHCSLLVVGILAVSLSVLAKGGAAQRTDLDIRFSKTPFINASLAPLYLPLKKKDYPIKGTIATVLKTLTNAASPLLPDDPEVKKEPVLLKKGKPGKPRKKDAFSYVGYLGSLPTYPTTDSDDPFWQEFRFVVEYQIARRNNDAVSTLFTLPDIWANFTTLAQVAQVVNNDFPGVLATALLSSLVAQKAKLDPTIIPFRSVNDPIGIQHRNVAISAWAISTIQPFTYTIKWAYGRPRPEEIAYLIATGALTDEDGVPADLIPIIKSWNLTAATQFTAYTQGSPTHPAWPSGHASIAQNAFWLSIVFNLTPEQYCQALRFDYAFSYARILAGLHTPTEAESGWKLGQEVLARKLPSHLSELYGANLKATKAKVASLRYDLSKFDPETCTFSE